MKRMINVFLLAAMAAAVAFGARTLPGNNLSTAEPAPRPAKSVVTWHGNLREAQAFAAAEYRPVLALFTSQDCGWCTRLKSAVLTDPSVTGLLAEFSLVEIDVTSDRNTAASYQVAGVPTVLIMSADGEVRKAVPGYIAAPEMKKLLEQSLNPAFLKARSSSYVELLQFLDDNQVPSNRWSEVMVELGSPERKKELQGKILKLAPFPRRQFVDLLNTNQLAVRLGAIEIIEELTGRDWGYDPWLDSASAASNEAVTARLQLWADQKEEPEKKTIYSALSKQQVNAYIRDIISGDNDRCVRAMRMLESGELNISDSLAEFLREQPDLPAGARNKIREVRYILALKGSAGLDASSTARKLLYGTLDVKMKAIADLHITGLRALGILKDFLEDRDPIVREATVDALIQAGSSYAVPILQEHLKVEKDKDVVYAALKNLGKTPGSAGMKVLMSYLGDKNEDLVVVALESLAKLKSSKASAEIENCLSDTRWRVRVAALEALAKLKLSGLEPRVCELLGDKDAFVRYSAVKALTAIAAKGAAPKLEEIFAREDDLKAAIVEAFVSMDVPVPRNLEKALKGKNPDLILAVLKSLDDCGEKDLWLAEPYLFDANEDLVCAAVRLIAARGMKSAKYRGLAAEVLARGSRASRLAALEAIYLDHRDMAAEVIAMNFESTTSPGAAETATAPAAAGLLDDIMNAFTGETAPKPVVSTNQPAKPAAVTNATDADVMALFTAGGLLEPVAQNADAGTNATAARVSASMAGVLEQVEKCMLAATDGELKFKAALLLVKFGNPAGLPVLLKDLSARPVAERQQIATGLGKITPAAAIPLVGALMRDPSDEVRRQVAEVCLEKVPNTVLLELLLKELSAGGALLKPGEIPLGRLEGVKKSSASRRLIGGWARMALQDGKDRMLQNLALVMLEYCWIATDADLVRKFIKSEDPWQRRAALHALGRCDEDAFAKELEWVGSDKSEHVRAVISDIFSLDSGQWIDYLDKTHFSESRYYYRSSRFGGYDRPPRLAPEILKVLRSLVTDESPMVRLEAYFCLLSRFENIDLVQFVRTIESFPDTKAAGNRVASFLSSNYAKLGQGFKILLPFFQASRSYEYSEDRVMKHFKIDSDKPDEILTIISRIDGNIPVEATYQQAAGEPAAGAAPQKRVLVYFTMPGCQGCEKVENLLPGLKEEFPDLTIEVHNIRKLAAKQINEAMSEKFGVPEGARLVAPMVFAGAGFLTRNDITRASLRELLVKSTWVPLKDWHEVSGEALAKADSSINRRFSATGVSVVAVAGFLDGINPCAFATIIFLLSYIQLTRRTPREIAQIGLAFIAGVFLAYFAMGLGLIELVLKLQATLSWFRQAVNWTLAAFSLVIMVLSVRDGILCMQGRMADMTLQLPGMLKSGIHGAIRRGAKNVHFVLAAFVVGVVISVLELACTGQVYLPTIAYMLDKSGKTGGAIGYLLLYNISFIVPLFVVFLIACFGFTSERLTNFLKERAAIVKFSTAVLFLILFSYFVFGDKIGAILQ